ncbi:MAG: amidohydrolase family protein [Gemmatimonadales bacterium]|nr:amidohydrolase family protein [Gemmatimonadales bacterium]
MITRNETRSRDARRNMRKGGSRRRPSARLHLTLHLSRNTCVALAVASLLSACKPQEDKLALIGAEVFDGTGAPVIRDAVIVVANGRIEAIGASHVVPVPRGAREMRLDGKWVIPGLIDAHTHAERWTLERFLAYGVTSIRDLGGRLDSVVALRDRVAAGVILGPRMYISGAMIDAAPATWRSATVVRTGTEARRAIDRLALIDAAQAKIYTKIDRRLLRPLMDEAAELNFPVAAHLGRVDALTAARFGVSVLEHMSGVVEATVENPTPFRRAHNDFFTGWNLVERAWANLDSASLDRTARELVQAGVAIVPTLALHEAYSRLTDQAYITRLDLSGVPDSARQAWDIPDLVRRARLTAADFTAFRRSRPAQDRFVRLYRRAGGVVAAGTDTPKQLLAPGASLHDELALLVDAGLTPQEALLAATQYAARLFEADSIGVLRPGGVADLLVLTGNPLEDIQNTRNIEMIMAYGSTYRPTDFKARW